MICAGKRRVSGLVRNLQETICDHLKKSFADVFPVLPRVVSFEVRGPRCKRLVLAATPPKPPCWKVDDYLCVLGARDGVTTEQVITCSSPGCQEEGVYFVRSSGGLAARVQRRGFEMSSN